MTQIYETVTETKEVQRLVECRCDLCDRATTKMGYWTTAYYHNNDTTIQIKISHEESSGTADGGTGDRIEVDMCPDCFRNKFVPWLKSQGSKADYTEFDW